MAKTANPIGKKAGPLPVWAWAVGAVVMFWLVKRYSSGSSSASSASPASFGTSTNPVGVPTGGGAPASGQGSAIDNNTAGLLASLFGNSVQINSNLVTGLLGAVTSIEGLGSEALRQNGATEQAIINGKFWGNAPLPPAASGGGGSGGGGGGGKGGGGGSSSATLTPAQQMSAAESKAHQAAVDAQGYWTAGF